MSEQRNERVFELLLLHFQSVVIPMQKNAHFVVLLHKTVLFFR